MRTCKWCGAEIVFVGTNDPPGNGNGWWWTAGDRTFSTSVCRDRGLVEEEDGHEPAPLDLPSDMSPAAVREWLDA